jgi:8-oxo-dGTP diphosphatase
VQSDQTQAFGQLFYARVQTLGPLPPFEIAEIKLFSALPENLTYPLIQPYLFKRIKAYLEK